MTRNSGKMPVERAVSAGGVVLREGAAGAEVVICGRDADDVWGLPKGTLDEGESLQEAAVREVSEETGLKVEIVTKIGVVEYWFSADGVRYHKWVHHYLMRSTGGRTADHDAEHDRVEWMPADKAIRRLTFDNDKNMVRQAMSKLKGAS
ncbi:MAG: NUDIX hydrolase [Chloroflexi bacterium]|nr:NUDIX hydrolase [Chloroflexota bacterium]